MTSLRGRLLVWLIGLLTAAGLLAGLAAYVMDRDEVDGLLDGQLRQIAVNTGDTPRSALGGNVDIDPEDEFVITVWTSSAVASSPAAVSIPRSPSTGFFNTNAAGEEWRVYNLVLPARTVQVAQRMVVRQEFASNSALHAVLPFLVLVPLSGILVGWAVHHILSPVRALAADLRGRDAKTATDPLPLGQMPDEILPLGIAMNELVARLHQQLEFRRRFISDAAHELRTPLTALRLQARNLRRSESDAGGQALVLELDRGLRRMSELTSQLLDLARAETPEESREVKAVDIHEPLSKALEDVVPLAQTKGIDLGVEPFEANLVVGDENDIRILLRNLLDNAVRYTPEGGTVDVALRPDGTHLVISVTDNGLGIEEAAMDRIFDRFFRAPGAAPGGSGLGLAIARALADRLEASLDIRNRDDVRGVVASVWLNRSGAGASPA